MPQVKYNRFYERDLTVEDAARQLSPAYAEATDQAAALRKETAQAESSVAHYTGTVRHAVSRGDARWRTMGTWRQYGHRSGLRRDPEMSQHEQSEQYWTEELAKGETQRDALVPALAAAERAKTAAFEAVRPAAEQAVAAARERVEVAREVEAERREQQAAEAQRERDRPRTKAEQIAERAAARATQQEEKSRDRGMER
jgi:hypothetical protein